jgi:hypothetical protein
VPLNQRTILVEDSLIAPQELAKSIGLPKITYKCLQAVETTSLSLFTLYFQENLKQKQL